MPIRFRKAGTVVRCPNCAGQVVVPTLEEAGEKPSDGTAQASGGQHMFEGNEIDRLLEGAGGDQPSALPHSARGTGPVAPATGVAAPPAPSAPAAQPIVATPGLGPTAPPGAKPPGGIWLSPAKATLLSVLAVVGLALSFGIGLLVGLFMQSLR
jgi:hypothetical protein